MQGRSAALYATLFLIIAAGAYSFAGAAQAPTISVDDPEYALAANETFTVNGQQYTATSVSAGSAEVEWVNQSARYTQTWENNSSVTHQNANYTVFVPNETDPSSFTLRSEQAESQSFSEGDTIAYQGNETTVAAVESSSVTLSWQAPRTNTASLSEGGTVQLNGQQFVAHFPDSSTLELSSDVEGYQQQVQKIDRFHQRIGGVEAVSIISFLTGILLIGLAFLPTKE